ncbi:MAG: LysR family transcriptional regulator [Rhodobacteraceae bacterium]|nr:LysR family transcriptional regulator [Paracoccaceae bacterium]
MNWDDLRYFECFAAAGSLSGAARVLDVEHATVARRISALESDLKLKLVDRRGRKLLLTPAGEQIAAIGARMKREAEQVLRHARSVASTLGGDVTISAPPALAAGLLAKPLTALRQQHPNLNVFVSSDIHTVSLDRREADIAIRLRRPETGDLTATRIADMAFRLYARPDYLDTTPEVDWAFIALGGALANSPQQMALPVRAGAGGPGVSTDQIEMQHAFARNGAGVAMLPDFLAADDPVLVPANPQEPPLMREVWLICHSDMKTAGPIRAVLDALKTLRI